LDWEKKLDIRNFKNIASRFIKNDGRSQGFDYKEFLSFLNVEIEKYKMINYLFMTLEEAMRVQRINTLEELFISTNQYSRQ
jgi:hypothetical protein